MNDSLRLRLFAVLFAATAALVSCVKENTPDPQPDPPAPSDAKAVNLLMDAYLKTHYLWNADYKKLKPDFTLEYDEFLSQTLMMMTTNIYDKKSDGEGGYRLYSYIERRPSAAKSTSSTRGVNNGQPRDKQTGFGIARMTVVTYNGTSDYGFEVSAVYPGSPAEKAGVGRGFGIQKVDGQTINASNYERLYYQITDPGTKNSVTLTENAQGLPTKTLAAAEYELNPVLHTEVISSGSHKIGYVTYLSYDAGFDDELLAAIARFKTAGINDLVLDLRLNGGGHVISAKMLSSCIAGAACDGKVFQYYRYNDDRMATPSQTGKQTGMSYDSAKQRFYENFVYGNYYSVDLKSYALNMTRLYVLVTDNTASASEATIGSLKGIGIPVTLIGERTSGKNVGMEPKMLSDNKYTYDFYPITFQGYNAQLETVDYLGMKPDYEVDDWIPGYVPFGDPSDPLLAKALTLITGQAPKVLAAGRTRAETEMLGTPVATPEPRSRIHGMIALPAEE